MNQDDPVGPLDARGTPRRAAPIPHSVGLLYCVGISHLVRQRPQLIDMSATSGPRRVGYMEDGVVLCASCVYELDRTDIR